MCGIAGILNHDRTRRVDRRTIEAMNQAIVHRGPDDGGAYVEGPVGLGTRRLSIIDIAAGHQPMSNEDGTVWITFNGEIYNHAELRGELLGKGHVFKTCSDTEVIVHLYEEAREDCVERLRGMFAFAIWDSRREALMLARDRLGIKPLYYAAAHDFLAFGSEIRALLAIDAVRARVDLQALHDYLTLRYTVAPQTMLQGILKLPPGHVLVARSGQLSVHQYWDLDYSRKLVMTEEEYVEEFSRRLTSTTVDHLVGEVPMGVLLSGGLDSTTIAAIVSEARGGGVKTFSVGFADDGEGYDERQYARLAAHRYGTDHHEITITHKDFVRGLPDYVWHMEEPMADPASIPLYYVSRLASDHVTVILSGEGSDELFAGYGVDFTGFTRAGWARRIPAPIRNRVLKPLNDGIVRSGRVDRYLRLAELPSSHYLTVVPSYMANVFSEDAKSAIYGPLMRNGHAWRRSEDLVVDLYRTATNYEVLDQMLYVYTKQWLPDDLLLKADKMTMAHSLELRVPFLDHTMVEFAASLPVGMKVRRNLDGSYSAKHILRKAFATRIPEEIVNRPKMGFPVPLKRLFDGELAELVQDVFTSRSLKESGLFDMDAIRSLARPADPRRDHSHQLWSLLVFGLWYDAFRVAA